MLPQAARSPKWATDWKIAVALCVALLLLRSWFFLAWEESYFDSDQAIVGLMAKHLAEGRATPLFFYGQEYILGVESWVAAPFIALLGTSVVALRAALVVLNLITGLVLVRLLVKDAGLGVWAAVAASSIFWIAPIASGSNLVEATGGNIEPFLWVLIVWVVRRRPLAVGVCLALGFLNREFSIYAAPMLLIAHLIESGGAWRQVVLDWTASTVAFLIVFTGVQLLKPHADLMGPGSAGAPVRTMGQDIVALVVQRVQWNPDQLGARFVALITDYLPTMVGFKRFVPSNVQIGTDVRVGWDLAAPIAGVLLAIALVLLVREWRSIVADDDRRWLFPMYLIGIGTIAAIVYPVTRQLSLYTMRYGLLVLYVPIGLIALMFQPGRRVALRAVTAVCVLVFATCSVIDHVRVLARARQAPPPAPMRQILTRLEAKGVDVAFADYWRSYVITFLSGERIKVASIEFERISEYTTLAEREVERKSKAGVVIQRLPCASSASERVAGWYVCDW